MSSKYIDCTSLATFAQICYDGGTDGEEMEKADLGRLVSKKWCCLIILQDAVVLYKEPEEAEILDDNRAKLEQIEEAKLDIEKQLVADETVTTDFEQLE